jgi:hypothetical protein
MKRKKIRLHYEEQKDWEMRTLEVRNNGTVRAEGKKRIRRKSKT